MEKRTLPPIRRGPFVYLKNNFRRVAWAKGYYRGLLEGEKVKMKQRSE